jgi:hypothetical protein
MEVEVKDGKLFGPRGDAKSSETGFALGTGEPSRPMTRAEREAMREKIALEDALKFLEQERRRERDAQMMATDQRRAQPLESEVQNLDCWPPSVLQPPRPGEAMPLAEAEAASDSPASSEPTPTFEDFAQQYNRAFVAGDKARAGELMLEMVRIVRAKQLTMTPAERQKEALKARDRARNYCLRLDK